jgi:hypothetical protein
MSTIRDDYYSILYQSKIFFLMASRKLAGLVYSR